MTDDCQRGLAGAVNHYPSLKYRSGHHKPKGVATMTRIEALNVLKERIPVLAGAYGEFLDAFVALGMLKLDEPKSEGKRHDREYDPNVALCDDAEFGMKP